MIVVSLFTPGCTGKAQPEISNTITVAPDRPFVQEFDQGIEDHTNARAAFDNAISSWNDGDYDNAGTQLADAKDKFALASDHYRKMAGYATNDTEREFADNMEGAATDMNTASEKFIMSISESGYDNSTSALAYFNDGQALVNDSMDKVNRSLELMPSLLQ